jgi:dTDP-4-dehydrorhamnose 3,5-epimerase
MIEFHSTKLPEVVRITSSVYSDSRGYFQETWHRDTYAGAGIDAHFVQDNTSRSCRHTLRGLHYQFPRQQGKLITCLRGEVLDVAVDIRAGSPRFGQWTAHILSDENHEQLWVPPGFAHGFLVQSKTADVCYKCTDFYVSGDDGGILWSDPGIGIAWPDVEPLLSAKDASLFTLNAVPEARLPRYAP